jgi:APA family basic amino acid/polyamine antiporter
VALPVIGIFYFDSSNLPSLNLTDMPISKALSASALLTMWAFIGVETGTVPAGQVKNPERNVPLATIIGTLIAAFIYILGTTVVFGVVPQSQLSASISPYAQAAEHLFGGNWSIPVAIAIAVTCLGTLNGWIMVVSRIPFGAAEDGLFPKAFMKTNRAGTPYWGVLISTICSIPLLLMTFDNGLLEQFRSLIDIATTQILIIYIICVAAYFVSLYRSKALNAKHYFIGGVAMIYSLWALSAVALNMLLSSCAITLCGLPMWLIFNQGKKKRVF